MNTVKVVNKNPLSDHLAWKARVSHEDYGSLMSMKRSIDLELVTELPIDEKKLKEKQRQTLKDSSELRQALGGASKITGDDIEGKRYNSQPSHNVSPRLLLDTVSSPVAPFALFPTKALKDDPNYPKFESLLSSPVKTTKKMFHGDDKRDYMTSSIDLAQPEYKRMILSVSPTRDISPKKEYAKGSDFNLRSSYNPEELKTFKLTNEREASTLSPSKSVLDTRAGRDNDQSLATAQQEIQDKRIKDIIEKNEKTIQNLKKRDSQEQYKYNKSLKYMYPNTDDPEQLKKNLKEVQKRNSERVSKRRSQIDDGLRSSLKLPEIQKYAKKV